MKWLLIVYVLWGDSPASFKHEFKTKEECVYVGTWMKKNDRFGGRHTEVQCFEVNK